MVEFTGQTDEDYDQYIAEQEQIIADISRDADAMDKEEFERRREQLDFDHLTDLYAEVGDELRRFDDDDDDDYDNCDDEEYKNYIAEQERIVVELRYGMETMEEDEREDLYRQLDAEHQMEVDEAIEDFANP